MKKTYIGLRDLIDPQNRFWGSGLTRKLTEEQAEKYGENIMPYEPRPKRFVFVDNVKMTWGEYLKKFRRKPMRGKHE